MTKIRFNVKSNRYSATPRKEPSRNSFQAKGQACLGKNGMELHGRAFLTRTSLSLSLGGMSTLNTHPKSSVLAACPDHVNRRRSPQP